MSCCKCLINDFSGFKVQLLEIKQNVPLIGACVVCSVVIVLLK